MLRKESERMKQMKIVYKGGEGEIVEVFQKGYKYKEKIIRYAMVKVAN